jgi:predicted O-linked N-acetylglucosamine transferase (SPINDLY family)
MYHETIDCYQKILKANPSAMDASNNLAAAYLAMGQLDDAIAHRRQFLQRQPNFILGRSNLLFALNNSPAISPEAMFQEHLRWDELVMGQSLPAPTHTNRPDKERRLRVGYVSPDFIGQHSVTYFIESLLANHDRQQFEIYGYAEVAIPDATTERFQKLCDHWSITHDKSDEEIAQDIQKDQIDILVDMAGHTASSRLTVFARKPAPVQVSYLGYPNTTGLRTVDYRLTDARADPPGRTERYHVEKLVRLPDGFLCYTPPADAPTVSDPPMEKNGYVTFGSFNSLAKITPQVIALWAEIMKSLPESRMVLKSHALTDARVRERFRGLFEKEKIESSRISLLGRIRERSQHLAQYHEIDISLDSFPYNGATTTCESLWMGVPVISLAGDTHAGRVGLSLLSQIGLTELACADREEYKANACKLAQDLPRLKILRQGLRQRLGQSPLSDGPKHARAVEAAYREMWRTWCDHPAT